MSTENIFRQDAEIPDIVQQKANLALAQIYERKDEETAKEAALKKKLMGWQLFIVIKLVLVVIVVVLVMKLTFLHKLLQTSLSHVVLHNV